MNSAPEFSIYEATVQDVEEIFSCKRLRENAGEEDVAYLLSLALTPYIISFQGYRMLFTVTTLRGGAVELHAYFPRSSLRGSRVLLLGLMLHFSNLSIKVICIPVLQNNVVCIRNSLKKLGFIEVATVRDKTFFMINLQES